MKHGYSCLHCRQQIDGSRSVFCGLVFLYSRLFEFTIEWRCWGYKWSSGGRICERVVSITQQSSRTQSQWMCRIESCVPIRVVWLGLSTEKLLLTSLVGKVSTDLVTVFFGLKERDKVDTRPHLLTGEFTIQLKAVSISSSHRCDSKSPVYFACR
jgi:hypothetical protein